MSADLDNDDLEVKMSKAKRYSAMFLGGATLFITAFVVLVLYGYDGTDVGYYVITLFYLITMIFYCLYRGRTWTTRYRRFRDQFQGLEPIPDEKSLNHDN
jgi:hypothetical protein